MKINIDIYCGFLGSGKTTLIKKMLDEKFYDNSTVIIENEFGEVSIDGIILDKSSIQIKNVNSGCICCSINDNFEEALFEINNKFNPSNIIIEPSGIAKLSSILDTIDEIRFKHMFQVRNVVCLVDSNNFNYYLSNFKNFYADQIKYSDKIFLTRIENKDKQYINNIEKQIKELNENAVILKNGYSDISKIKKDSFNKKIRKTSKYSKFIKNKNDKDLLETFKIDVDYAISEDELRKKFLLINNKLYGNILRAKGILKDTKGSYYLFNYVQNEVNTKNINWCSRKVISIIGQNLDKEKIKKVFI